VSASPAVAATRRGPADPKAVPPEEGVRSFASASAETRNGGAGNEIPRCPIGTIREPVVDNRFDLLTIVCFAFREPEVFLTLRVFRAPWLAR
jgi:hypothetical protein